jgi:hypothetical protein
MLESTHVAHNALDARLARLASLGLRRPGNVLLAEYLAALATERILDDDAVSQVSAAYNRLRYAPAADDDPQLAPAVAALETVARRLAELTAPERADLIRRVSARLPAQPADGAAIDADVMAGDALDRDTVCLADARTPVPPTRSSAAARDGHFVAVAQPRSTGRTQPAEAIDDPAPPKRSRAGRPRLSVELLALVALITFFSGYFSRELTNKAIDTAGDIDTPNAAGPTLARDAWKQRDLWGYCVRERAAEDARTKNYGKARLALELALADAPQDSAVLNDLAALYLLPDADGHTDAARALELIERALASTRQATILDTAAAAHFCCGHVGEAIRLEKESLACGQQLGETMTADFRERCRQQLERYQAAAQAETGTQAASPPKTPATSRS